MFALTEKGEFIKQTSRKPSNLSDSLHRRLNSYALAASAAGVGMLAFVQPSEARIVYTPAHKHINGLVYLDLNRDDISDFVIAYTARPTSSSWWLYVLGTNGRNQIAGLTAGEAAALLPGVRVGSQLPFGTLNTAMAGSVCFTKGCRTFGQWANHGKGVKNRYLGLEFLITGKVHYGWARLSVAFKKPHGFSAILTGYAYETIPNKPIIAGKTHGKDVITVEPASLGHLARGASEISRWRSGK